MQLKSIGQVTFSTNSSLTKAAFVFIKIQMSEYENISK